MTRIAVMGAGLIGRRHAMHVAACPDADLACVIDPSPVGQAVAQEFGAPWAASLDQALANAHPDGVIVATPNQMHFQNGLDCIAAGLPALIEKPLCDSVADAQRLVPAAEAGGATASGPAVSARVVRSAAADCVMVRRLGVCMGVYLLGDGSGGAPSVPSMRLLRQVRQGEGSPETPTPVIPLPRISGRRRTA